MLKITNPWILFLIGSVLLGLTAFGFQEWIFAIASLIVFGLNLYFVTRNFEAEEISKVNSENS